MSRSESERLGDIVSAIDRCLAYREFLDSADFGAMAYDAVLRNLAVVGEAVRSLPDEFKSARPTVAWASIAGLRTFAGITPRRRVSHLVNRCRRGDEKAPIGADWPESRRVTA